MNQNILPTLGSQGTYELLPPFDTKITPEEIYTCKAIRSISEYISYNQDAKKEVYDYYGLTAEDYENDVKEDMQILSLQNDNGVWLYVPKRFVSKYPDVNGIPYKQTAIVTKLPALKSDRDLSFLITDIENLIKDTLGVDTDVSLVELSRTIAVVKELSDQMEAERSLITSGKSTDRSRYISLKQEIETLLERIKKLEEYIKSINGIFRLDGPDKIIKGSVIPYKIIGYNNHMEYNVSVTAGTVEHSTRYINYTAPDEVTTVTITVNDIDFVVQILESLPNINTPVISIVNDELFTGPDVGFITDTFSSVYIEDEHISTDWEIATDAAFTNIIDSIERSSIYKTHFVATNLQQSTTYYVRARFYGADIHVSEWGVKQFTTRDRFIEKPTITQPVTGTNNLGPNVTFVSDEFSVINGNDVHRASLWQVATDTDFTDIVAETEQTGVDLTSYTANNLLANTTYYARVKYFGYTKGNSGWSDVVSINTLSSYVIPPLITSPFNNVINLGPSIDLESSSFRTLSFSDEHVSSDWQVATDTAFTNIVFEKLNDSEFKIQCHIDRLPPNDIYYARVRYNSDINGTSNWSEIVSFTTKVSYIKKPIILQPVANSEGLGPVVNITSTEFEALDVDEHTVSDWQVSKTEDFSVIAYSSIDSSDNLTSYSIKNIDASSKYYIRVRYKGNQNYYSEWSNVSYFFTHASYIKTPEILKPEHGNLDEGPVIAFSSTPYEAVDNSNHASSDWQISTNREFTTTVINVVDSPSCKTKFSEIGLNADTVYHIRVRYKSQYGFYSNWSDGYLFKTKPVYISTPKVIMPERGDQGHGPLVQFVTEPYVSSDGSKHQSTDWQVSTNPEFTTTVLNVADSVACKTAYTATNLNANTTYYLRVRHKNSRGVVSDWSEGYLFATKASYIDPPDPLIE